jgi:vacuolar-type H+-ATPase subunit E/Vma4
MSAEKIVEKILSDAKLKVKEIEEETKNACLTLQKDSAKKIEQEKKEVVKKATLQGKAIKDNYKTLSNLDKKKIELVAKQDIIFDAKDRAVQMLYSMEKSVALKFVTKLVKSADVGDTMKVDFKNLTLTDVKKIKGVKDKKLKVEKGEEKGVVFEGDICDKNFSLIELVSQKYNEDEKKYNDILFG